MIRVTVELLPYGLEQNKQHLGTVVIANDGSGTKSRGNYKFRLSRRGQPESAWLVGTVENFPRLRLTAYDLLYLALKKVLEGRHK